MALALLGALLIGITLGLLGSGGSIVTVPILLFILQRPEKLAIAESLAIVGSVACAGAIPYILRQQVQWMSVLFFGFPGIGGAYLGAYVSYYISGTLQVMLLGLTMLVVAGTMFVNPSSFKLPSSRLPIWVMMIEGFCVGMLTGLIGVGGGFLIVPTLVLFHQLPMHFAVGTSLVIIVLNSFTGFVEQLIALEALQMYVNWEIIGTISIFGILGSFAGSFLSSQISAVNLRKLFSLSVLIIGVYILLQK